MIKLILIGFSYFAAVLLSCFSFKDKTFFFQKIEWLTVFSGALALYAIYCEHRNRNKDDNRMIYVAPLLSLISAIKEINDELDIIAKMTIYDGCEKLKNDIEELQKKSTSLAYKISNGLQETDKKYGFKNKDFFEQYMEEHIYLPFTHLSQNLRQDETSKKVFEKDVNNLKSNIVDLVNNLTEMVNKISDKL